jgi:hypothetical protein
MIEMETKTKNEIWFLIALVFMSLALVFLVRVVESRRVDSPMVALETDVFTNLKISIEKLEKEVRLLEEKLEELEIEVASEGDI